MLTAVAQIAQPVLPVWFVPAMCCGIVHKNPPARAHFASKLSAWARTRLTAMSRPAWGRFVRAKTYRSDRRRLGRLVISLVVVVVAATPWQHAVGSRSRSRISTMRHEHRPAVIAVAVAVAVTVAAAAAAAAAIAVGFAVAVIAFVAAVVTPPQTGRDHGCLAPAPLLAPRAIIQLGVLPWPWL